jgi:hypothetical protein
MHAKKLARNWLLDDRAMVSLVSVFLRMFEAFLLGLFVMAFGVSFRQLSFASIEYLCYNGTWMGGCGICRLRCTWWQNSFSL